MYFKKITESIIPFFHTLDWNTIIDKKNNIITFRVLGLELEEFSVEVTKGYIFVNIPLTKSSANYLKRFYLTNLFEMLVFLQYHVNNFISEIIKENFKDKLYLSCDDNYNYKHESLELIDSPITY